LITWEIQYSQIDDQQVYKSEIKRSQINDW